MKKIFGFDFLDELPNDVFASEGPPPILGTYKIKEIEALLRKFGIWSQIESKGFTNLYCFGDARDDFVHRVCVSDTSLRPNAPRQPINEHNILIDLFVRRRDLVLENCQHEKAHCLAFEHHLVGKRIKVTVLEYLRLQDPRKTVFDRPMLPNQIHPGLGVANALRKVLVYAAASHDRDALLNVPEAFHNAFIYAYDPLFLYLDPSIEGLFRALVNFCAAGIIRYGLAAIAWAVHTKYILVHKQRNGNAKDEPEFREFEWFLKSQVRPTKIGTPLERVLNCKHYASEMKASFHSYQFRLPCGDWESFADNSAFEKYFATPDERSLLLLNAVFKHKCGVQLLNIREYLENS